MRTSLAAGVVGLAGLVTACGGEGFPAFEGEELSLQSGRVTATVAFDGGVPVQGDNVLLVTLEPTRPDATASLLGLDVLMPAHGHGTNPVVIVDAGDHYRVEELALFMPGRWDITLDLEVGGASEELPFTVDVE